VFLSLKRHPCATNNRAYICSVLSKRNLSASSVTVLATEFPLSCLYGLSKRRWHSIYGQFVNALSTVHVVTAENSDKTDKYSSRQMEELKRFSSSRVKVKVMVMGNLLTASNISFSAILF